MNDEPAEFWMMAKFIDPMSPTEAASILRTAELERMSLVFGNRVLRMGGLSFSQRMAIYLKRMAAKICA